MQRVVLGLLCVLAYACSTPLYVEGYDDQDGPSISGDAQVGDAQVGDARVPDGGRFDGSIPGSDAAIRDGAVDARADAADFAFECEVYDVPASCPFREVVPNASCSPTMTRNQTCPSLTDDGFVDWLQCRTQNGASTWRSTNMAFARCGHDCDALPATSFFNLDDSNCMRRGTVRCDQGVGRTSQENLDTLLNVAVTSCGLPTSNTYSVTFNGQGCPDMFLTDFPRLTAMQQRCMEQLLQNTRIVCDLAPPSCASTTVRPLIP